MSEHGHGSAHAASDVHDESRHALEHVQPVVWMFIALAIVLAMWQGYNVVSSGGDAHVWPASNAVKVDLPPQQ
jgi:hypothetical protein